jgi:hypothetical protein
VGARILCVDLRHRYSCPSAHAKTIATATHLEAACCWEGHAQLEGRHCLLQRAGWHHHSLHTLVDQQPGPCRSQPAARTTHNSNSSAESSPTLMRPACDPTPVANTISL